MVRPSGVLLEHSYAGQFDHITFSSLRLVVREETHKIISFSPSIKVKCAFGDQLLKAVFSQNLCFEYLSTPALACDIH